MLRELRGVVILVMLVGCAIACLNPCKLYELNPLVFSPLSLRVKGEGVGGGTANSCGGVLLCEHYVQGWLRRVLVVGCEE